MLVRSRSIPIIAPLALLLLATGCAKEPSPEPGADVTAPATPASATAQADAKVSVEPKLNGSVFLAGNSQIELAISADGRVDGLVYDAAGQAVPPDHVTDFSVTLDAEGTAKPRVNLLWDATLQRFRGQADVAAALVARPIDVNLRVDGNVQTGVLATYTLLPAADVKLEAHADATLPAPQVSAKARLAADARGLADVKPPKLKAPNGAASLQAKASAKVAVPKPKASVSAKASAGTEKKKAGAGVKAKVGFGFGN